MRARQRTLRIMLSGILLMATLACGVYVYRYESNKQAELKMAQEEQAEEKEAEEESAKTSAYDTAQPESGGTEQAQAEAAESADADEGQPASTDGVQAVEEETDSTGQQPADADADTTASDAVLPALDFNEGTLLNLPLSGEILIPYNMEHTVYFSTLDQYRCNPAVMIAAETETPVAVVANSQVLSVAEDPVTGTTVTMDMGNGYQAVYGQLKDVTVEQGQTVAAGTVIAKVSTPSKYFVKEGSNLYFAMTKDGAPIDPTLYLPPETE